MAIFNSYVSLPEGSSEIVYIANILRNIAIHEQEIPFSTNHNKGTQEGFEHCSFRQKHLAKIINVTDLSGIIIELTCFCDLAKQGAAQ